jgi:hypothetical protein
VGIGRDINSTSSEKKITMLRNITQGDQTKKNEMGGTCGTCRDRRSAFRVLVGGLERKRPLGRPRLDGRIILRKDL